MIDTNRSSDLGMQSQKLVLGVITFGALIVLTFLTTMIVENEEGSMSAVVLTVGVCLAMWAAVKPRAGLFIISIEAFTLDFVKKVAVYYGAVSTNTIMEVLIVGMLAVAGTIAGILVQSVAMRRYHMARPHWAILIVGVVLSLAIFSVCKEEYGIPKAGEHAFNGGVYIALALPMALALAERQELRKLLDLQFWLAAIWALWGIKQYYTGFTALEWYYADTGLSEVSTAHMYLSADPRPFGFASGAVNYGVISAYVFYGCWRIWQGNRGKVLYTLGTLVLFWGSVTSMQRTLLLMPFIGGVFFFCFRTAKLTIIAYSAVVVTFVLGVLFSERLLENFDDINNAISMSGRWGENVLVVNTFSDRLFSWQYLLRPTTYSWFGSDSSIPTHDIITKIVLSYGVVGLAVTLAVMGGAAFYIHRTLLRIADLADRKFATLMIAFTMPSIVVGLAGGGNFMATPVNLQLWTFFGAAIAIVINGKQVEDAPAPASLPTIADRGLRPTLPARPRAALARVAVSHP